MAGICKSLTNTAKFSAQAAASGAEVLALGSLTVVEIAKPVFTAVQKELPEFTKTTELAVHTASLAYRDWVLPSFIDSSKDEEIKAWIALSDEKKDEFMKAFEEATLNDSTSIIMAKGFSVVNGKLVYKKP